MCGGIRIRSVLPRDSKPLDEKTALNHSIPIAFQGILPINQQIYFKVYEARKFQRHYDIPEITGVGVSECS